MIKHILFGYISYLLDLDECSSDPCQNGGSCLDRVNTFICECTDMWQGVFCETEVIPRKLDLY